jgi:hypothetical protein
MRAWSATRRLLIPASFVVLSTRMWLPARSRPKAKVSRVVRAVANRGKAKPKKKVTSKKPPTPVPNETQHERDLSVLQNLWEASSESAREEFLSTLPAMVYLKHRVTELEDELKELRSSCKCGVAEPPDLTATVAAVTVNDGLDIPDHLRRY